MFTFPSIWWCLVPVLATHTGGVLGAWLYYLAIELHWTKQDNMEDEEEEEAEPLPVKKDLEAAALGENGEMSNGGGAPPMLYSENSKSALLHDELRFKMNQ